MNSEFSLIVHEFVKNMCTCSTRCSHSLLTIETRSYLIKVQRRLVGFSTLLRFAGCGTIFSVVTVQKVDTGAKSLGAKEIRFLVAVTLVIAVGTNKHAVNGLQSRITCKLWDDYRYNSSMPYLVHAFVVSCIVYWGNFILYSMLCLRINHATFVCWMFWTAYSR